MKIFCDDNLTSEYITFTDVRLPKPGDLVVDLKRGRGMVKNRQKALSVQVKFVNGQLNTYPLEKARRRLRLLHRAKRNPLLYEPPVKQAGILQMLHSAPRHFQMSFSRRASLSFIGVCINNEHKQDHQRLSEVEQQEHWIDKWGLLFEDFHASRHAYLAGAVLILKVPRHPVVRMPLQGSACTCLWF